MKSLARRWLVCCLVMVLGVPVAAFATNGYFLIGYGAKSRGMGGVGVAYAQDGLAAASNPAGMTEVDMNTMRIDAGADLFSPPRSVYHSSDTLGTTNEKSGSNLFLIPNMGGVFKFNRKIVMGMAAVGAGLGTRYNQVVPDNPSCINNNQSNPGSYFFNFNCHGDSPHVGVMLMQMQMLPSIAYKVSRTQSVGASLAIAVQSFRAYGLGAFSNLGFAPTNSHLSNEGNSWSGGGGIRLGWLGKFMDNKVSLGANWSSRVYMSHFQKYTNLFAQHGDFDIPQNFAGGIAVKATDKITVAADIEHIQFSSIASVGHKGPVDPVQFNPRCPGGSNNPICQLGGEQGMGFGWTDQTVYKLGLNYDYDKKWSFRGGLNYGKSPIPKDQVLFNMLAPATVELHYTLGASYRPSTNMEWSFSFVHAFENTITGTTAFTNRPPGVDNAAISMYQNAAGVSFGYKM